MNLAIAPAPAIPSAEKPSLLGDWDTLVDAAGSLKSLRELVLQLAIRGRLGTQSDADEPAAMLLERLRGERLKSRGSLSKAVGEISAPFALPQSWVWARLDQVWRSIADGDHQPPPKSEQGVAFLTIGNVSRGELDFSSTRRVSSDYFDKLDELRVPMCGDLLYTVVGSFGIPVPVHTKEPFCVQRHIAILKPLSSTCVPFFRHVMASGLVYRQAVAGATGIAQPTVGLNVLRNFIVPLPPLEEQKRIVARVDQLMALIDDLEAKQTRKRETSTRFTKASLEALTTAEGPDEFDAAWKRVMENWETVLDRSEKVGALRRAIRDLAVSGNLLGDSSQLDARNDGPFAIPVCWQWQSLGQLARSTTYGTSQRAHEEPQGVPVLRMNNIQDGQLDLSSLKYVPADTDKLDELMLASGDLLFNRTNSYELVGKMAVFRDAGSYTFASYLIRVRPDPALVVPEYLNLYFGSDVCRRTQIEPHITVQTNQANYNGTKLKGVAVPTPPLAEQKRIVAKVEHLMRLCDALEAKLRRAEDRASKLVDAVVQEMVA